MYVRQRRLINDIISRHLNIWFSPEIHEKNYLMSSYYHFFIHITCIIAPKRAMKPIIYMCSLFICPYIGVFCENNIVRLSE